MPQQDERCRNNNHKLDGQRKLYFQRMKCRWRIAGWLLGFLVLSSTCAFGQGCSGSARPDCSRAVDFFHRVQDALKKNDQKAMAELMEYPFLTRLNGRKIRIRSKKQLLAHFDQIFDASVTCPILRAHDDDMWGNSHGYTVGLGIIWFDAIIPPNVKADATAPDFWILGTFKIITVNNESKTSCQQSLGRGNETGQARLTN